MQNSERLVLYLRDINLPKADKYGTSQVMAFLQQLLTYQGFYDAKLQFVGKLPLKIDRHDLALRLHVHGSVLLPV